MSAAASISTERPGGRVAVIGAGPGGLAAARFLRLRGFAPVLIEAHDDLGGQWNSANPRSGVWPEMRTNTARMVTRFSTRLDHLAQIEGGFRLHLSGPRGEHVEDVPKVVIATGRYNAPEIAELLG